MPATSSNIAVVIAAFNSASTIRRAVCSALAQNEVLQCIVVDDGSNDETAATALAADDSTGRLKVISLSQNQGPATARNTALDICQCEFVCILDADDYFIEGRLKRLLEATVDFDLLADNILIVPEERESADIASLQEKILADGFCKPSFKLELADFVRSNIPRRGRPRAELGFLKPIIRRTFLEQHKLRYDPQLRLGEDYAFYARALMAGARFRVVGACGYVAVERLNSISSRHTAEDLSRLAAFDSRCLANGCLTRDDRVAFLQHLKATRRNAEFRRALQSRAENGLIAGLASAARHPLSLKYTVSETMRAKWKNILAATCQVNDDLRSIRLLIGEAEWR